MEISRIIALALWGFLVGFVCWGSLFRLAEPVGDWLVASGRKSSAAALARVIVSLFLIFSTFLILSLLPIFFVVASARVPASGEWRAMFMTAYACSMVGFFALGFARKFLRGPQRGRGPAQMPRSVREK